MPHYKHDSYWSDPTHVRAFTALTFEMMSRRRNDDWIARGANYTMLSYALDVDFEAENTRQIYDRAWLERERSGELTRTELRRAAEENWGVVREIQVILRAVKTEV